METKIDILALKPKYQKTISLEKICKWFFINNNDIPCLKKYKKTIYEKTKESENKQIKKN